MTATTDRQHVTDLTFPLGSDYVKTWTTPRALGELIANAIDADPTGYTVEYRDGSIVITDTAENGIGTAGMVLGVTTKTGRTDQIGQFGEGLLLAGAVLARDDAVGRIHVDTVGYSFDVTLTEHTGIAGLNIPVTGERSPQVLTWRLYQSDRTQGTVVTVECPEAVAREAMGRFLHLSVPGYTAPAEPGRVITDGAPGRIYVGGVFVTEKKNLVFSYDLSLTLRGMQNRDRTVLDGWQLTSAVQRILNECEDADVLTALVERVTTAGAKTLGETERSFTNVRPNSPAVRRTWDEVKRRVVGDRKVYYSDGSVGNETLLNLADRGYTEFKAPGLERHYAGRLMVLLGVPNAESMAKRVRAKTTIADYVADKDLTDAEKTALAGAVRTVRAVYGPDSLGKVKVYSAVRLENNPCLSTWAGFYLPATGDIAVHRRLLVDPKALMETLVHEAGHRIAHRFPRTVGLNYPEHADRTRGFEQTLGAMASRALEALASGATLETLEARHAASDGPVGMPALPAGIRWLNSRRPKQVPVTALPAAQVVADAITATGTRLGIPAARVPATLEASHFVSAALVRQLREGTLGYDRNLARVDEVADLLGLPVAAAPVLWWAQCGAAGPYTYKQTGSRNKRFAAKVALNAVRACDLLERAGGPYAAQVPALRALIAGRSAVPVTVDSDEWQAPVRALLDALTADIDAGTVGGPQQVAASVHPGPNAD